MSDPRPVFLNDVVYTDGGENPLDSLVATLAFSINDWGESRAMSWVWGIVCGWDDDDSDGPARVEGAMDEQAAKHGWNAESVARLRRLHATFERMRTGEDRVQAEIARLRAMGQPKQSTQEWEQQMRDQGRADEV